MPEFTASSFINAPIDRVWAFHESPEALSRLTPPGQGLRVLSHSGGIAAGARLVISVKIFGPIRVTWRALHTLCTAPTLFVDEQESGPFAYWRHEHRFAGVDGGTLLTDSIVFRLPGGALLNWFAAPFVRFQLAGLFRFRHATTQKCCE